MHTITPVSSAATLTGVSSVAAATVMDDPTIVVVGIGEYDGLPNLPDVVQDYNNVIMTFVNEWKFKAFYQFKNNNCVYCSNLSEITVKNDFKLKWTSDEISLFVEKAQKCTCIVDNKHNGMIFHLPHMNQVSKVI